MDYNSAAKKVIEGLGGKENIVSAAHCATRLRLVIGDTRSLLKTSTVSRVFSLPQVSFRSYSAQAL